LEGESSEKTPLPVAKSILRALNFLQQGQKGPVEMSSCQNLSQSALCGLKKAQGERE